jgi:hypothetical protein
VDVTVAFAVADKTLPSGLVHKAVIVQAPTLIPVTTPEELTLAIVGMFELHAILGESVSFSCRPVLPEVPKAMNWLVCPEAETDTLLGLMASAVSGSDAPPSTVRVACAVTTVLLVLVAMAVMVLVPLPTAVARPPGAIVATWALLEPQATWLVRSSVAPEEVVPIAMNWLVWVGDATDCVPGIMASETSAPPTEPPPVAVTVIVAVALTDPAREAVIVAVPAPAAVASPDEFTVATVGALDIQVAWSVTFEEEDGWLPWLMVPVAVNCTVWPTTRLSADGVIWMEPTCVLLQPVNGRTIQMSPSALMQLRADILSLLEAPGTLPNLSAANRRPLQTLNIGSIIVEPNHRGLRLSAQWLLTESSRLM